MTKGTKLVSHRVQGELDFANYRVQAKNHVCRDGELWQALGLEKHIWSSVDPKEFFTCCFQVVFLPLNTGPAYLIPDLHPV